LVFLAAVTGIGGGTFRDIVLGDVPVFWVGKPAYLVVCVVGCCNRLFHGSSGGIALPVVALARCRGLCSLSR
jgi:uncharacterized membrane protein YeiH